MRKYIIEQDDLNKIAQYLSSKPYIEVHVLLKMLAEKCTVMEEEPKDAVETGEKPKNDIK